MSGIVIDPSQELAEAQVGPFHRRLCVLIAVLAFFDGFDVFNPAYVIHYVVAPWGLRPAQAGLLLSSGLLGFLIGATVHGLVADRIGRRATLLAGLWITSVFTLATALFVDSFASFCLMRIATGLGLGTLLPLGVTYINELAPRRVANVFSLWGAAFGWSLGGTAAALAGAFVTPTYGWQSLYLVGSLSFGAAVVSHDVLPESPAFLALRGRHAELASLLAQLRPERAALYAAARFSRTGTAPPASIRALLAPRYRRVTLAIWTSAFLSLFAIFGLTGWVPTVMIDRGETFAASYGFGALIQIMSLFGALACGAIADRLESDFAVLSAWWGLGGLCTLALALFDGHAANVVLTSASGVFVLGAQHVLNNLTARAYGTGLRATGVGMELGVGRVGAILGPFLVGALQQVWPGPGAGFVAISFAALLAAAAIGFGAGRRRDIGVVAIPQESRP